MEHLHTRVSESAAFLAERVNDCPQVGIILGSGLGGIGDAVDLQAAIDYHEIPYFFRSTAIGHNGRFFFGRVGGKPVVAMQGRLHRYEGYSAEEATFPVRVMQVLGIKLLIVSNAAGGLNPLFSVGDVMVVDDHINFVNRNPLIGVNDERLGPRFPDMSSPYDRALAIARVKGIPGHRGTYIGVLGPNDETRAEIRMLRNWGDAVGMSTVPEVITASHANLRVFGLSTITNICSPDVRHEANGDAVVAAASAASSRLQSIVVGVLEAFADC